MALMNPKDEEEEEEEISRMQTDITDEEMALRYKLLLLMTSSMRGTRINVLAAFISCSLSYR